MSAPPPPADSSSLLVSAGLFLVVVLASQVIQNRRNEDKDKEHHVDFDLGHRYSMKRPYWSRESNLNTLAAELKHEKEEASLESVCIQTEYLHVLACTAVLLKMIHLLFYNDCVMGI